MKFFNTKFQTQLKDWESSYQVREVLGHICHLIAVTLGLNRMEDLRVSKRLNEIKFDLVWGELESKQRFQRQ